MRIFDCFIYFDEDLILDLRLRELNKYVDKFIIVESGEDHQGNSKKKNFNINNFYEFKNKIDYYYIEKFPEFIKEPWKRENYQRNQIARGIQDASDNDLIIVSDVDEIPNLKKIKNFNVNKCTIFYQKFYQYKLNLLTGTNWPGSRIIKKKFDMEL